MKLHQLLVLSTVVTVFAAPVASSAQSDQPVTRAEVRAQPIQLEKNGYNSARNTRRKSKQLRLA
jgi:hypothetical protein